MNTDDVVVGTCGLCGGPVVVPKIWHGINQPPKRCARCGATAKESYGPVLPMNPPVKVDWGKGAK